jgi:hypothetical protein
MEAEKFGISVVVFRTSREMSGKECPFVAHVSKNDDTVLVVGVHGEIMKVDLEVLL